MNEKVGSPRIGQWYLRSDTAEAFLVTGLDRRAATIEIQSFDGDLDEIDANNWSALPLEFAEPPEDAAGTQDSKPDQTDSEGSGMPAAEALETLEPPRIGQEAWEDATEEDERDPLGDGFAAEEPLADHPEVKPAG